MRRGAAILLLVPAGFLAGCLSNSIQADQPARVVGSTPESRAELQRVVSTALQVDEVTLAHDALKESSWLVIERSRVRNLDNAPLQGRDLGRPERFQLVLSGPRCVLVHERDGSRYPLLETACVTE
jgi:hypothetical protein